MDGNPLIPLPRHALVDVQRPLDASAVTHHRRLDAIRRLQLLSRAGDPTLTAISRLASHVTGADSAAVHILDDRWQHRIAAVGAPLGRSPARESLCREVVSGGEEIVCADATAEPRFRYSPFVSGPEPIRFYAALPLHAEDGGVIGTVCAFDGQPRELDGEQLALLRDVASQAAVYVELLRVATELGEVAVLDPLTGAVNQVVFHDRLAELLARRLPGTGVVVAALDVDHFKTLNDTRGHAAGDAILRGLVDRLAAALGPGAMIGRLGGDEFAVAIETVDPTHERLRRTILDALGDPDWPERPSVTVGAVLARPDERDPRAILRRADERMYAAKRLARPAA